MVILEQVAALEMLRAARVQHSRDIRLHFVLAQTDVQQTGLEEAQAAVEHTCTGVAHAAAEEARPEATEQTLPEASQIHRLQIARFYHILCVEGGQLKSLMYIFLAALIFSPFFSFCFVFLSKQRNSRSSN
jgi:hypothetical protein